MVAVWFVVKNSGGFGESDHGPAALGADSTKNPSNADGQVTATSFASDC